MTRILLVCCCLLVSGCPTRAPHSSGYPAEITGIGESKNFPLNAAGYRRGKTLTYESGIKNYSIGYDVFGPALQNAITLYFYPGSSDRPKQFEHEKRQIVDAHAGATLLGEGDETFEKEGGSYPARIAKYRYVGEFAGRRQELYSELILVPLPARYLKVRSTAPFVQGPAAASKVRELLGAVNWAH